MISCYKIYLFVMVIFKQILFKNVFFMLLVEKLQKLMRKIYRFLKLQVFIYNVNYQILYFSLYGYFGIYFFGILILILIKLSKYVFFVLKICLSKEFVI